MKSLDDLITELLNAADHAVRKLDVEWQRQTGEPATPAERWAESRGLARASMRVRETRYEHVSRPLRVESFSGTKAEPIRYHDAFLSVRSLATGAPSPVATAAQSLEAAMREAGLV